MHPTSRLAALNSLVRTASGVWTSEDQSTNFDYSDGDEAETRLKSILSKSSNPINHSIDLEEDITDWVSEYHFSSLRGNLLRYLNLEHCETILELGCGCGALTNHLGQLGLSVDAIEGSLRRADIARLRCKDFDNVQIYSSNFYDLSFPSMQYDVIFFVGVMEYAGRFVPDQKSAEEAVEHLLKTVESSLTTEGVIIVGIENRLGRKYLCGAGEDHYGVPFEGIHGYPNYSGIKTWSRQEWGELIGRTGLKHTFHYPFPDYKLPTLILNDQYVESSPNAWTHLTGLSYRDYHQLITPTDDIRFWEHSHKAGHLGSFANSFLIAAAPNEDALGKITPYNFAHFSSQLRRPRYRIQTHMLQDSDVVQKLRLYGCSSTSSNVLQHDVTTEEWQNGMPLSNLWIKQLRANPHHQTLEALSTDYFRYLETQFQTKKEVGRLIDALPMNIMVGSSGEWVTFDHEWIYLDDTIDAQFVFFRGLYYFFQLVPKTLASVYATLPDWTIQDALTECFSKLGLDLHSILELIIEREDKIQSDVMANTKGSSAKDMLNLAIALPRMPIQLFWRDLESDFSEKNSQTKFISVGELFQTVTFHLPIPLGSLATLRFDPGTGVGDFSIENIHVLAIQDDKPVTLQSLTPEAFSNKDLIQFNNIRLGWGYLKYSLLSLNNDPHLCWDLPPSGCFPQTSHLQVRVRMKWLGRVNNTTLGIIRLPSAIQNWLLNSQFSRIIKHRHRFRPCR